MNKHGHNTPQAKRCYSIESVDNTLSIHFANRAHFGSQQLRLLISSRFFFSIEFCSTISTILQPIYRK